MKKKILLFTAIAGVTYFTMSSNATGAASGLGVDGTKGSGTTNTCGKAGCHTASTNTAVALELDSAGIAVSRYVAGKSYTIKITGTNNGSTTLPKFGFQLTVVKSTGAGTSTAANAGTLPTTGLPSGVQFTAKGASFLPFDVVEHSTPNAPATGTGGTGTTYVETINWTAPATAGTGSVVIYGCINAVNFTGDQTGDAYNSNSKTITELIPSVAAVSSVSAELGIKAFPNPMVNTLNLQLDNTQAGEYNVAVFSLGGKVIATEKINVTGTSQTASINTSNWAAGTYMVSVEKDGNRKVIAVVK